MGVLLFQAVDLAHSHINNSPLMRTAAGERPFRINPKPKPLYPPLQPPPAEQRHAWIVRHLRRIGLAPAGDLIERRQVYRPRRRIRVGQRRFAAFVTGGFGDVEGFAGAGLAGFVHCRQAVAVCVARFAAAAFDVRWLFLEVDRPVVQVEELQRLVRGHRRDRWGSVVAPFVMVVRAWQGTGQQRELDRLVAGREREAHLAGEGGASFAAGVEGGVAEPGGGGREADIGGDGERGEKGLLGGVVEAVGGRAAELETAVGGSCRRGRGVGAWRLGRASSTPDLWSAVPLPVPGRIFESGGC